MIAADVQLCALRFPFADGYSENCIHLFVKIRKRLEKIILIIYNILMASVLYLPSNAMVESGSGNNAPDIQSLKESLAKILAEQFRNEFKSVHLSGQLMKSITITSDEEGNFIVEIPPKIYDIAFYKRHGVVKPISQDSYAFAINFTGGFSGLHKGYFALCVSHAIQIWKTVNRLEINMALESN